MSLFDPVTVTFSVPRIALALFGVALLVFGIALGIHAAVDIWGLIT